MKIDTFFPNCTALQTVATYRGTWIHSSYSYNTNERETWNNQERHIFEKNMCNSIFATIYNIELLFYFIFKIGCQNLE